MKIIKSHRDERGNVFHYISQFDGFYHLYINDRWHKATAYKDLRHFNNAKNNYPFKPTSLVFNYRYSPYLLYYSKNLKEWCNHYGESQTYGSYFIRFDLKKYMKQEQIEKIQDMAISDDEQIRMLARNMSIEVIKEKCNGAFEKHGLSYS